MDKPKSQDTQMIQEPSLIDSRPKDVIEKQRQQMKLFIAKQQRSLTIAGALGMLRGGRL